MTPRVYLVKGDGAGWAIDEDLRQTRLALEGVAELVERPEDAQVIHACWWEPLLELPAESCAGRAVVCHMAEEPARCLTRPEFLPALSRVTHWVAQSRAALDDLRCVAGRVEHVPYGVDFEAFQRPSAPPSSGVLRASASLPQDAYVVVNFHRDTLGSSYAGGGPRPKMEKGADALAEVLDLVRRRGVNAVALLAGPRRHWLRAELARRGVPCVFAGEDVPGDDYPRNILRASDIAHLLRLADLHVCLSRHEGGPRGVLEAAAAGVPQVSTRVGHAPEVLAPECVVDDPLDAAERIVADARDGVLRRFADAHRAIVRARHTTPALRERWREVYRAVSAWRRDGAPAGPRPERRPRPLVSLRGEPQRVCLWHDFRPPPWGGGNQFMLALKGELERRGVEVCVNGEGPPARSHLIQAVWFDTEKFERCVEPGVTRVVHRIDGPISTIRRTPDSLELDRRCFELNRRYATASVLQSRFILRALGEMGFAPVRPMIVHNAVDPTIFHPPETDPPRDGRRPLRVIASSWSDNPGKGAAVYEWLGRELDPARFSFTFVGQLKVPIERGRHVPAQGSAELAALLRSHDVYLTASREDPCSNALVEALACGLPAVYYDSGGHPELVRFAGLPFRRVDEIPGCLERLHANLDAYRRLIRVDSIADVADRYLRLLLGDRAYRA